MKKFITLTIIAITTLLLAGCNKEKEHEKIFSLSGTTWAGQMYDGDFHVFRFINDNEVEYTRRDNSPIGPIGDCSSGTYELNYPTLTIIGTRTWNCTFVNEQIFRSENYFGHLIEFHLQ
ncbi:MAG: hypothetical protein NC335_02975 [Bacteroides sp.]|nr:hypothetical protein [Bacteroides sp.]